MRITKVVCDNCCREEDITSAYGHWIYDTDEIIDACCEECYELCLKEIESNA